jgi:pimeloyl-ACP methyl ester carboxylesterase
MLALTTLTNFLLAVGIFFGAVALYQYITSLVDAYRYPPPGEQVDIGGCTFHLQCAGAGSFTVVFDSGSGGFSLDWEAVRPAVASMARTVVFDRAGYAWSDSSGATRDAVHASRELHALLERADITGPLILVGHSLGGLYAQYYAAAYPEQVAGLVLVDPAPRLFKEELLDLLPEEQRREGEKIYQQYVAQSRGLLFKLTRLIVPPLGLFRLIGLVMGERLFDMLPPYTVLPPRWKPPYRAMVCQSKFLRTRLDEADLLEQSAQQVRAIAPSFGDLPLVVLSAEALGGIPYRENMLPKLQRLRPMQHRSHAQLARLSSRGKHLIVERSAHYIHVDQPQCVIEAIRQVIEAATASEPAAVVPLGELQFGFGGRAGGGENGGF